jgi:hypothetical protein
VMAWSGRQDGGDNPAGMRAYRAPPTRYHR